MNYQLHRDGQEILTLSFEELQRRRQTGELNGSELVWCEGMTQWQTLDSILPTNIAFNAPPPIPPPLPKAKNANRQRTLALWVAAVCTVILLAVGGSQIGKFRQDFNRGLQEAGEPEGLDLSLKNIPLTTNSATEADVKKRGGAFRTRLWLEGYLSNGDRNLACDGAAVEMLQGWIASNFSASTTNEMDVLSMCDKLAVPGTCEEPLVLTVAALNSPELHEKARRLERAIALFPASRHKAYPKLNAEVNMIDLTTNWSRLQLLFSNAERFFAECFEDGSFSPADQPEIAEIFIHGWGYNYFYRTRENMHLIPQRFGKPFEWLAMVFEGEYHVIEAWKARGGGYSDTVTKEGWDGFSRHLAAARKNFSQAWKLRPDLPLAPSRMIYVSMGESDVDQMRNWFDRSVAAQIDYPDAWEKFRFALRPRWHGSLEAMQALGKSALDTGRFDTDVPRKFFDVVSDLESELKLRPGQHIYGRPDIWPDLTRMYEGYLAEPSAKEMQAGWRSSYAVVAYLAEKYDVAREQLEALQWQPWSGNTSGWGTDLSLMPMEVSARTGIAGAKVTAAEKSYRQADWQKALGLYEEIAALSSLDSNAAQFVRSRLASLNMEKQLATGDWAGLLPSGTNDPAWVFSSGKFSRAGESLEVRTGRFGHLAFSRARVGPNFEVRGEFEVVSSSSEDFQAGLVMGLPSMHSHDWHGFRIKRNKEEGQVASFAIGWGKQQIVRPAALNRVRNSFDFRLQNGRITASVNGTRVFEGDAPPRSSAAISPHEFLVGVGAYHDMNETVIRYHGLQIRRLSSNSSR